MQQLSAEAGLQRVMKPLTVPAGDSESNNSIIVDKPSELDEIDHELWDKIAAFGSQYEQNQELDEDLGHFMRDRKVPLCLKKYMIGKETDRSALIDAEGIYEDTTKVRRNPHCGYAGYPFLRPENLTKYYEFDRINEMYSGRRGTILTYETYRNAIDVLENIRGGWELSEQSDVKTMETRFLAQFSTRAMNSQKWKRDELMQTIQTDFFEPRIWELVIDIHKTCDFENPYTEESVERLKTKLDRQLDYLPALKRILGMTKHITLQANWKGRADLLEVARDFHTGQGTYENPHKPAPVNSSGWGSDRRRRLAERLSLAMA